MRIVEQITAAVSARRAIAETDYVGFLAAGELKGKPATARMLAAMDVLGLTPADVEWDTTAIATARRMTTADAVNACRARVDAAITAKEKAIANREKQEQDVDDAAEKFSPNSDEVVGARSLLHASHCAVTAADNEVGDARGELAEAVNASRASTDDVKTFLNSHPRAAMALAIIDKREAVESGEFVHDDSGLVPVMQ